MLRATLIDQSWLERFEGQTMEVEVSVTPNSQGIIVRPKGYGDSVSNEAEGCPILIELFEGHPRVIVWDNINDEDSTHVISLENAQESLREDA